MTTDAESGQPYYLDPAAGNWLRILWASATLPLVSRGRIKVQGQWMFDGGIADALPLQAAIDAGGRNLLVIRTRPSGQHIHQSWMDFFAPTGTGKTRPSPNSMNRAMRITMQPSTASQPEENPD